VHGIKEFLKRWGATELTYQKIEKVLENQGLINGERGG